MRGVAVPFRGVTGGSPPPSCCLADLEDAAAAADDAKEGGGVDDRLPVVVVVVVVCCGWCGPELAAPRGGRRSVGGPSARSSAKAARTESVGFWPSCSASRRRTGRSSRRSPLAPPPPPLLLLLPWAEPASTGALRRCCSRSSGGTTSVPRPPPPIVSSRPFGPPALCAPAREEPSTARATAEDEVADPPPREAAMARVRSEAVSVWKRLSSKLDDSAESWTAVCVTWWMVSICSRDTRPMRRDERRRHPRRRRRRRRRRRMGVSDASDG